MFYIGDRVVYPMHGAGVIESVEEKNILGEIRCYYIMRISVGNMKVMVPTGDEKKLGLREIIGREHLEKIRNILSSKMEDIDGNWNRRYRANMDKIKSGNIFEVTEVVKNLMLKERGKSLSAGEKRMLDYARQILISELVLVEDQEEKEIDSEIEDLLNKKAT